MADINLFQVLQRNLAGSVTRGKLTLGFIACFPVFLLSQSNDSIPCGVLDSIFNHLGDLFPKEEDHRRRAIRLYELSGKGNFKYCEGYDYDIWSVYHYAALAFDINSGASVDFVILEDTLSGIQRTIRFFYAQAFCEHSIRNKIAGYIILEYRSTEIKIRRISSFYMD